jgi:hypothetical protein
LTRDSLAVVSGTSKDVNRSLSKGLGLESYAKTESAEYFETVRTLTKERDGVNERNETVELSRDVSVTLRSITVSVSAVSSLKNVSL